jgi:hypothetical protein
MFDFYFERVPFRANQDALIDVRRDVGTFDVILWKWRLVASLRTR